MWNNMPIVTPSLLPRRMFAALYKGRNEGKEIRRFSKFSVLVNRLAGRTFLLYRLIKFYEPTISAFPAVCSQKSFFRHEVNWHYSQIRFNPAMTFKPSLPSPYTPQGALQFSQPLQTMKPNSSVVQVKFWSIPRTMAIYQTSKMWNSVKLIK